MRHTIGGVLVVCAITLGACGTDDTTDAGPASSTTIGATATEATTEAPAATAPAAPAYRLLSDEELTGALLEVQGLPAGYSQEPPVADSPEKTFCDYEEPVDIQVKVRRDFVKGGGVSSEFLSVGLRQYASPEEAEVAFEALIDGLASCSGETYQGSELTYAPMSAPDVGDGSVGVKISADGTDLLQFFSLVGPTLVNTGGGGLMNANADEVTGLLEDQVNRYEAAAAR